MIVYEQITHLHLELSTFCNARCPLCPRNFYGYPYNDGYPEINLTLDQAKKIFPSSFLLQIKSITIEGNFGDATLNPETIDIIDYFRLSNPEIYIEMHTNGSGRSTEFWKSLARQKVSVIFALDGLRDTHSIYRQDTDYDKILKNAKTFIAQGGRAIWKLIPFKHNLHQIDECRELANTLGFAKFFVYDESRNAGPVYDKQGNLVNVLGEYKESSTFDIKFYSRTTDLVLPEDVVKNKSPKTKINCQAKKNKQIYVSANGDVGPCCYLGFYPKTYGHGAYHQAVNLQIKPHIQKNNALEYSIEECIKWFSSIEQSWNIPDYEQGRLIACDDNCGQ